jgi:hypothetical protein
LFLLVACRCLEDSDLAQRCGPGGNTAATGEFEYADAMGDGWRRRLVVEPDIDTPAPKI